VRGTGVIKLSQKVKRIQIENQRIKGVLLADGTSIDTPCVVSNADYKTTFMNLLDLGQMNKWYQVISKSKQTNSVIQVALGLDRSKVDLTAFSGASRLIYRRFQRSCPLQEIDVWSDGNVDSEKLANEELEISLWSDDDPSLSPDWGAVVIIRCEAQYSHFLRFISGSGQRTSAYNEYKHRIAGVLINVAEDVLPGLGHSIVAIDVATPLTFADLGGRSEGAIAGWSWNYNDFNDFEPKELVLTPIKGLYMAGYQAFSALFLGGVPTAMVSGCLAAEAVLGAAEPTKDLLVGL
jgi:phytoene dehydrogenase-like protein